jgi:hypothetical protein
MANQIEHALRGKCRNGAGRRKMKAGGRDVAITLHGVWRPINGERGLSKRVLGDTDLIVVSDRGVIGDNTLKANKKADLWKDRKAYDMLRKHEKEGRVLVLPGDLSGRSLREEIKRRMNGK